MKAKIIGTSHWLPSYQVDNFELFKYIDNFDVDKAIKSISKKGHDTTNLSVEEIFDIWVKQVTGIEYRYFVNDELKKSEFGIVETMGYNAALKAIEDSGIDKKDIDTVIFTTYTMSNLIPNPSVTVSYMLGLEETRGITLNTACSGSLDALAEAYIRIKAGEAKNVLVVAADYMSGNMDFGDVTTSILFGDGASAAVVTATNDEKSILGYYSKQDYSPQHISMEYGKPIKMGGGPNVQKNAVLSMKKALENVCEKSNCSVDDLDVVIPHQANLRILKQLQLKLKKSDNEFATTIQKMGNLSCATVLTALDKVRKGEAYSNYSKGETLAGFTSVGGGYTYSALVAYI